MAKKIFNIKNILFSPILIILLLCSCSKEDKVIGAEDFSLDTVPEITVEANPALTPDSSKYYTNTVDGQKAMWTTVNYLTNGQHIILEITGRWTAWGNGKYVPQDEKCNMVDIGNTPMEIYSAATNYQNSITMEPLHPDSQYPCWFEGGSGLYLGLFGPTGTVLPKIMFHLQTTEKSCKPPFEIIDNDCVLVTDGVIEQISKWTYRYTTVGDPVWAGTPPANQKIKFVILDSFYRDNYGSYQIKFLSGVSATGGSEKEGLISSVVKIIEDAVFGYQDANGNPHKGIIEILYKQLLSDSIFGDLIRILLILAIAILGFSIIAGTTKLTQKEILNRMMKIGIVLLFTSNNAWQFFNDFVITWFILGTNFIISFFTSVISQIFPIQVENLGLNIVAGGHSLASNFNFIDYILQFLFSSTIQIKIWALFFSSFFGIVAIILIYLSIFAFIFVLIYFAQLYIFYILQIGFALALAPIFASLILFEKTKHLFFNWLTFLIGRSLEIIFMFLFVYLLVGLILTSYLKLFSYSVGVVSLFDTPILSFIKVWKVIQEAPQNTIEIPFQILIIFGLIYIMYTMITLSSLIADAISSTGSLQLSSLASKTLRDLWKNATKPTLSALNRIPKFEIAGISLFGTRKTITEEVKKGAGITYRGKIGKRGTALAAGALAPIAMPFAIGAFPFLDRKTKARQDYADKIIQTIEQEGRAKGLTDTELEKHTRKNTISKIQKGEISPHFFTTEAEMNFYLNRLDTHFGIKPAINSLQQKFNNKGINEEYRQNVVNRVEAEYNKYQELPSKERKTLSEKDLYDNAIQTMIVKEMAEQKKKTFEEIEDSINMEELKQEANAIKPDEDTKNFFTKAFEQLTKQRLKGIIAEEENIRKLKEQKDAKEREIEKTRSDLNRQKSDIDSRIREIQRKSEAQRTPQEKTELSNLENQSKTLSKQIEELK